MSGRRYRRRGGNSLGSVVDDSVRVAARFGPVGALTTGAIGFAIFYAALPITLLAWADANKVKLVGPAAAAFANLLDQVMWHRFIGPSQWAGIAILLACWAIAAWKAFYGDGLTDDELAGATWLAKLVARLLR
jgi:hypothetical protein